MIGWGGDESVDTPLIYLSYVSSPFYILHIRQNIIDPVGNALNKFYLSEN